MHYGWQQQKGEGQARANEGNSEEHHHQQTQVWRTDAQFKDALAGKQPEECMPDLLLHELGLLSQLSHLHILLGNLLVCLCNPGRQCLQIQTALPAFACRQSIV